MFFRQKGGKYLGKYRKLLRRKGERSDMRGNEYTKKYSFWPGEETAGKRKREATSSVFLRLNKRTAEF